MTEPKVGFSTIRIMGTAASPAQRLRSAIPSPWQTSPRPGVDTGDASVIDEFPVSGTTLCSLTPHASARLRGIPVHGRTARRSHGQPTPTSPSVACVRTRSDHHGDRAALEYGRQLLGTGDFPHLSALNEQSTDTEAGLVMTRRHPARSVRTWPGRPTRRPRRRLKLD
jgi:hypothetical protein